MSHTPKVPARPEPVKRRFVTIVYEIVDDAKWCADINPLNYQHHGLKSVGVSVGDLMRLLEEVEPLVTPTEYQALYDKHVIASMVR